MGNAAGEEMDVGFRAISKRREWTQTSIASLLTNRKGSMLPDYTNAKAKIHEVLMEFLQERIRVHLGPFAFKEYRAFEGRAFATTTEEGKRLESGANEISGRFAISTTDVQSGNPQIILEHLDNTAREIAEAQTRNMFATINRICEEAGQTLDFNGQRLSPEVFLRTLESIFIEFNSEGKANDLMFVITPQLTERAKEVMNELHSDPKWKQQHDELMCRKLMEWRDREDSRKLVG